MKHVTAPGGSGGVLERPRYFPRQLMTPDELTLEADYFRDRLRRHNIHLHGWGVVCGALVCVVPASAENGGAPKPWVVQVQPGYVLGPYGDEIVIGSACEVPLQGNGVVHGDDLADPWCTEVYVAQPGGPRYLAVRYREVQVRPVRAQPAGCGCDETACENSRFRDGYEFGLLDTCPASHQRTDASTGNGDGVKGNPVCPEPPDSPWVVLAEVTVDDDGTITSIDNCACRRIVASARDNWYSCGSTDADFPPPEKASEEAQPTPAPAPAATERGTEEVSAEANPPKPATTPRRRRGPGRQG